MTKDKVKAVELFKLAADQGCADAQFWLGKKRKDLKDSYFPFH